MRIRTGLAGLALAASITGAGALTAGAAPPEIGTNASKAAVDDELPNAAEEKRRALREAALEKVITGKAKPTKRGASTVVRLDSKAPGGEDQYVELGREKTDKIFVVLAEFGDTRHASYPDQDTNKSIPGPATFNGPLVNKIPAPDRSKDNSTVWQADYGRDHYQQLYFGKGEGVESLKTFYERQSSGRYSVDGLVTDWVKVPYNEARYGRSNGVPCTGNVCSNTWSLIKDAVDAWVTDRKAAGWSDERIKSELAGYDTWDRNDYDGDGNFNEADGYIDHFQIVHAGGDQADGDPQQGEDAIWSHRWKAFQNLIGTEGPSFNKDGGTPVGTTGLWVADYTIQPENGGLSVFAHEYGHDLGLPDHYDTAGGPDNAVSWWTLMGQSRASAPQDEGIGTRPADLGAWDKLQLGWLDYEVVPAGTSRTLDLGPHEYNSAKAQGVVVPLGKTRPRVTDYGKPTSGANQWWSGQGDDYQSSLTREVTLAQGTSTLKFNAHWNIEDCEADACDYAFVQVDDGTGFKSVAGSITKPAEGNGIDGQSDGWVPATFDLSSFAGKTVKLRLHYRTDGAVQGQDPKQPSGLFADDVVVTSGGQTVLSDDAEHGDNGWTKDGFRTVGESSTQMFDHYYVASNRQYVSYDKYLQSGPYNFGFPQDRPDWVEHFPYQNGLLVSYWDTSFTDNNESQHPGEGEVLPIDSHPQPIYKLDGLPWRGRIQTYDSPFGLEKADSFTLHDQATGQASYIRGQAAEPVFDDRRSYWSAAQPTVGVKVPNAGVKMEVRSASGTSMKVRISSTK